MEIFIKYFKRKLSIIVREVSFMQSSFWSENLLTFEFRYTSKISCCFRMELEDLGLLKNHR